MRSAPLAEIERFRQRMGWPFKWVSSNGNGFNYDFAVGFTPEVRAEGRDERDVPYLLRSRSCLPTSTR